MSLKTIKTWVLIEWKKENGENNSRRIIETTEWKRFKAAVTELEKSLPDNEKSIFIAKLDKPNFNKNVNIAKMFSVNDTTTYRIYSHT